MIIQYAAKSSIPLYFEFVNASSGTWDNFVFNVQAGASLSSTTAGLVTYSIFLSNTNTIATSTLNGAPISLTGLFANALTSSGSIAVANITEGLSGGINNPIAYDCVGQLKFDNPANNSQLVSQVRQTFYVLANVNDLNIVS